MTVHHTVSRFLAEYHAMDPLSVTKVVVTLLVFTGQVGTQCHNFYEAYGNAVKIVKETATDIEVVEETLSHVSANLCRFAQGVLSVQLQSRVSTMAVQDDELFKRAKQLLAQYEGMDVKPQRRLKWALVGNRKATGLGREMGKFTGRTGMVLSWVSKYVYYPKISDGVEANKAQCSRNTQLSCPKRNCGEDSPDSKRAIKLPTCKALAKRIACVFRVRYKPSSSERLAEFGRPPLKSVH